ncbi:MAG TPA: glutamine amidotransferase [Gammaproteobacteria bacterium]|nr:glutamine amidotransferase [Gammaproteobacteria bacterium]
MKTLLAIRHVPFEDLGGFESVLDDAGYAIQYADAPTTEFDVLARRDWDLVVVLGGPISSNDGAQYPFLTPELKLIEARLKAAQTLLGICLGSQLMARALGATVRRAERAEIGWYPLTLTEAGRASPLRHFTAPVFHWHGETFELPAGAEHLASSALCAHQGFRIGTHALALQFHPEVTARGLEQWYVGHVGDLAEHGLSPAILRQQAQQHATAMQEQARAFLEAWLSGLSG